MPAVFTQNDYPQGKHMTEHSAAKSHDRVRHHHVFYRFHLPHVHLTSVFGDGWFALQAERFARFFGTPVFIILQTIIVIAWMTINVMGWTKFDEYPFILLNLAFSLQAAYAAPLILLAQTRQADRDKAHAEADAQHREDLAHASDERQVLAGRQQELLLEMLKQNTDITATIQALTERLESLTKEVHDKVVNAASQKSTPARAKKSASR